MSSDQDKSSKLFRAISVLILVSVILIGAYSGATSYLDYNSEKAQVEGTVISSEVDRDSTRRGVSYTAEIQYEYTYNGETYNNDNVKPGSGTVSVGKSEAESLVSDYSEDDVVTVYVDTKQPSTSWLVDELPIGNILASTVISLGGLFILYKRHLNDII